MASFDSTICDPRRKLHPPAMVPPVATSVNPTTQQLLQQNAILHSNLQQQASQLQEQQRKLDALSARVNRRHSLPQPSASANVNAHVHKRASTSLPVTSPLPPNRAQFTGQAHPLSENVAPLPHAPTPTVPVRASFTIRRSSRGIAPSTQHPPAPSDTMRPGHVSLVDLKVAQCPQAIAPPLEGTVQPPSKSQVQAAVHDRDIQNSLRP
jgi:hypothetical protein